MAVILWNLYYMAHSNHMIYKITRTKCCWGRVWATQTCKKRKWKQIKIIIKTNSWHFKKICLLFCIVWSKVRKNGAKNTENIIRLQFFFCTFSLFKDFCGQIYDDRGVPLCFGFKFSQTLFCCSYKNLSWETTLHSTCVPHKTFKNYLSELLRSSTYRLRFRRSYKSLGPKLIVFAKYKNFEKIIKNS